jgi:hypothetical protein
VLTEEIKKVISASDKAGWIMEPEAKRLLSLAGLEVPRFKWARALEEGVQFGGEIGYPVVAKIVSTHVIHKTERGGVVVGIEGKDRLTEVYDAFSTFEGFEGMIVEEMLSGVELIAGAKMDYQFGPVILLGIGGTGVEIYKDTALRMAPLEEKDVASMLKGLKAHQLLEGYRGSEPVNLGELSRMLMGFSRLVMELEGLIESIDLNPVMCSSKRCVIADARIILTSVHP